MKRHRWRLIGLAVLAAALPALTFAFAWDEQFDLPLLAAWGGSVAVWWVLLRGSLPQQESPEGDSGAVHELPARTRWDWIGRTRRDWLRRMCQGTSLLAILVVGGATFYLNLDHLPEDMIADHAEYIFDVRGVLDGETLVYFAANSGREPLHVYAGAGAALLGAGVGFLALKLVSATAALLTLPALYLIGRDLDGHLTGLLAAFFGATAAWHLIFARMGFRVVLASLASAWLLWLLLRALRSGRRVDFLAAGVVLGLGMYGYSAFRLAPLLVLAGVILVGWMVQIQGRTRQDEVERTRQDGVERTQQVESGRTRQASSLRDIVALGMMALVVYVPLLAYGLRQPGIYWQRAGMLVGGGGSKAVLTLLANVGETLLMFPFGRDPVALNLTAPGAPVLLPPLALLAVSGLLLWLWRALTSRDPLLWLVPLALVIFLLPSALALNTPLETPSARRAIGALPVVLLLAGFALATLTRWLSRRQFRFARAAALLVCCLIAGVSGAVEVYAYATRYPTNFQPEPHRAIAAYIENFARRGSPLENAHIVYQDRWVDVRIVAIWLGSARREGWQPLLPTFDAGSCERTQADRLYGDVLIIISPSDRANLQRVLDCFTPPGSAEPEVEGDIIVTANGAQFVTVIVPAVP